MYLERRRYYISWVFIGFCLACKTVIAVEFQPGVGVSVEHTDNAKLTRDNLVPDQIATVYAGAKIVENAGPLTYDAKASVNKHNYTQDAFTDQSYYNLAANADWEMVPERFNWTLSDAFGQRAFDPLESNTPNNLEDSNIFKFGANIRLPISPRQDFYLTPLFSQYYYERSGTDNKQHSIKAIWAYQMSPLTNVGFGIGVRDIDYSKTELSDTIFTNGAIVIDGKRMTSKYNITLGATNVKRDVTGGEDLDKTGFAGSLNYTAEISSRSVFKTLVLTEITDTSSVTQGAIGNADDVQLSTDVARNKMINVAYQRDDEALRSSIWVEHREFTYSSGIHDRIVRSFGAKLDHPVTQLLSTGVYAHFNRTTQLESPSREDKKYTIGGNIRYRLTGKLHSMLDIKYRSKESTDPSKNYDEFSVFASLVYGFGGVSRATRVGAF